MAGNYQQTIVIGTVGTVSDLKYTDSGTAIKNFSVAVNEYWNDRQTNERQERTTWYNCSAWSNTAETLHKYIAQGTNIMVTGNVTARAYTANDGSARASLDLRVQNFQLLGSRGDAQPQGEGDGRGYNGADLDQIPF